MPMRTVFLDVSYVGASCTTKSAMPKGGITGYGFENKTDRL
jgi:hypothetical protein